MSQCTTCIALLLLLGVVVVAADSKNSRPPSPESLFSKYCYECHGDGVHKGKIAIDDMLSNASHVRGAVTNRVEWERAWRIVRNEFMPPADAPRPTAAERRLITQWIEQKPLGVDYSKPDPGRVTSRRLNRMEYEFTITDLFGVDFNVDSDYASDRAKDARKLRDRLPPDDTAFGFDNNGDFLSLSPALLDKFFNLAEFVVDNVVSLDGPRHPQVDLVKNGIKESRTETNKLIEHHIDFDTAYDGPYKLDVQFNVGNFAEIAGVFEIALKLDDKELSRDEILVGGHKTHHYTPEMTLAKGHHHVVLAAKPVKADAKGKLNFLEFKPRLRLTGPVGTGIYEYPLAHRRIFFQGDPPGDQRARRAYAHAIIRRVADRAFRRPADEATLNRLTELVMRNEKFEAGVARALTAILSSPKFLFRTELQPRPDDPKSIHAIDEYALASRLSYLLWLSIPDEELNRLAAQGKLRKNLPAQLKRMLADSKSERFFEDFPGQWLRTRNVLMTAISRNDAALNPVRGSMKKETEMLFESIARSDRDLLELVTADYTFVDKKLAEFYGLKGVDGEGFQKVSLTPDTKRGGVLTHGSFLVSTSNPNRTSPVKRGLFVLENLFATQVPPPPGNVPPLDEAKVGGVVPNTVREQLAAHRENKSCAACHAHFDPIGVVLENYDIIGRWRDKENGNTIETHEKTTTGETLSNIADIRALFETRKDKYYRCLTEKLLTYAIGRGLEPFDAVTVDRITDRLLASNGKFSALLESVVDSPAFQTRRGDDGATKVAPQLALPATPPPEKRKGRRFGNFNFNNFDANQNIPATNGGKSATDKPEKP